MSGTMPPRLPITPFPPPKMPCTACCLLVVGAGVAAAVVVGAGVVVRAGGVGVPGYSGIWMPPVHCEHDWAAKFPVVHFTMLVVKPPASRPCTHNALVSVKHRTGS